MSKGISMLLAAVIGGVVVGSIVWFVQPQPVTPSPSTTQEASAPASAIPARSSAAAPLGKLAPSVKTTPPWASATAPAEQVSGLAAAIHSARADSAKSRQLDALHARLVNMSAGDKHPSLAQVDEALADLMTIQGTSVIAGVDFEALRGNLAVVAELQQLSSQLQAEVQRPGGGDKAKIESLMTQLKQLQSKLQLNVRAPAPAPAGGESS